ASAGYEATRKILGLTEVPTAIFCQNDRMAIGCYEALKEAGYEIPADMSVIGYDDEEIARHMHPRLTTAILPHRAMGQCVLERLSESMAVRGFSVTTLECPVVVLDSVAAQRI